ncbi:MAG: PKD domain-containing protein [Kiritimatiellae bacterium]|nr:PKD domain-containing protein [Kiritimatiellia bacterium]
MMANCMNRVWNKFRDVAYPLVLLGVAGWTSLGFAQEVGGEGGEPNEPQPVAASVSVLPPDGAVLQDGRYIVSETNGTGFVSVALSEAYQDGDGIVRVRLDAVQPVEGVTNLVLQTSEVTIENQATNALVEFSILDGTVASTNQGVTIIPTILNDASNTFTQVASGLVYVQNEPPQVTVTSPSGTHVGDTILAAAGDDIAFHWTVQDLNVDGCTVAWNFGDGNSETFPGDIREGEVTNAYATAGTYTVVCTVNDKDGGISTARCKIRIPAFPLSGKYVVYTGGGTGALTDGDAWMGGTAPGADDIAVFINGFTGTLAESREWGGILVLGERVEIEGAQGVTLSLGADGITAEANLKLVLPISLAADQTFDVKGNTALALIKSVTKNGHHITFRNEGQIWVGEMDQPALSYNWEADDTMIYEGTTSSTTAGLLNLRAVHSVSTAQNLRMNWFVLSQGIWDHRAGTLESVWPAVLGCSNTGMGSKLLVNGGEVKARRFSIGMANLAANPAEMIVSNGLARATLNDRDYGGVEMCLAKSNWGGVSPSPEAYLTIAGGTLSTSHIRFGTSTDRTWVNDGYAQVMLKGGELELRGEGIFETSGNDAWRSDSSLSGMSSWQNVTFSGGTVTSPANNEIAVRVRLSDADGGTTVTVPSGKNLAFLKGLYGDGSLRKTGTGGLRLIEPSTFTGRLDVAEGAVAVGYEPTAIFRADDLTQGAGEAVTTWTCSRGDNSSWNFNTTVAKAVNNKSAAPTVAPETINGHKALRFNGTASALAMTGNAVTPASGKKSLTVFAVVRATETSQYAAGETNWRRMPQIIGAGYNQASDTFWGLCVNSNGCAGAGVCYGTAGTNYSAWSSEPFTNGSIRVLGFRWSAGGTVSIADNRDSATQKAAVCTNNLVQTRILLGMNENKNFFSGDVAELVFYNNLRLSDGAYNQVGYELARKYGAEFEPVITQYSVPEPDAVWSADSLTQGAGEQVTEWRCANEGTPDYWNFTSSIGAAIANSHNVPASAPVISANTFNGHKAVSFNGTTDVLGISKNTSGEHPFSGVNKLTAAVVFRAPETSGSGKAESGWSTCAGLIAMNLSATKSWGISLTENGRMGMGVRNSSKTGEAAWSQPRKLNDGLPHVAIFSYKGGDAHRSCVDGHRFMADTTASFSLDKQRVVLGMNEGCHHFAGEIAEIRFYRGVALDLNQMMTLGQELAVKYGCDRYNFDGNYGPPLPNAKVLVREGATFKTMAGCTMGGDQVISGAGSVVGLLNVASNAVLSAADGSLALDELWLEPGGILDVPADAGGEVTTVLQAGNLTLPDGVVTLRVNSASTSPHGVFLRWTGTLRDNGAGWRILGGNSASSVRIDPVAKTLRVLSPIGTILMVR